MNKKLIPTYVFKSIYDIDFNKIKDLGVKYLFVDLDNTLASPYVYLPSKETISLVKKIKEVGLNMFILSNNHEERVKKFASPLDVSYLYEVKKPSIKKISKFVKENNIDPSLCLSIGDQVMTDVLMANKMNFKVILVDPLTKKDELITFIPRMLDTHFRKKMKKKNLLKEL